VEKSIQKADFSTRPAEGGLDPVQGFALPTRSPQGTYRRK